MRTSDDLRGIAGLAARQHGVVTRDQLSTLGLTARVVHRLVVQGHLHRVHTRVFAVGHPALTTEARWLAATLALGPTTVLSHRAAGTLWRIVPPTSALEVTVPTRTGHTHRDAIRVHRQRLERHEHTELQGIPTTTLVRTLLDLAAVLDARGLAHAFEEAQVIHGLSPATLAAELGAQPGRRGSAPLRALLAGAVEPRGAESVLELRFLQLCTEHGLPRPLTQVRVGRWRVDFWFPRERLAVETDGLRYHATAAKRARDARKAAALATAGAGLLRLGWTEVVDRPHDGADRVRAALARWSPEVPHG